VVNEGPIPKVTYRSGSPASDDIPLVAIGVAAGAEVKDLPPLVRAAAEALPEGDFRGGSLETALLYTGDSGSTRFLLIGLGKVEEIDPHQIRRWAIAAAREARRVRIDRFAAVVPSGAGDEADRIRAAAHGAILGARFVWKEKDEIPAITEIVVCGDLDPSKGQRAAEEGARIAEAVLYARRLAIEPPNLLPPAALAAEAMRIADEPNVSGRILDEKEIASEGLSALLAVGSGSANPPRFIRLTYEGAGADAPTIALVGKGITFDSGGLSLKAPDRMIHMKYDMSGAAAVLAATRGAVRLGLPIRLVTVVPSAENLPGARSYRPGDVIDTYKGHTVEVDNTDAEGRLILADGLAWAERNEKPHTMINVATLTGACKIALGRHAGGLFSNDDSLADDLLEAGAAAGQRLWRLPLWKEYEKELKSDTADMKNIARSSAVGGGAPVAAAFLGRFVDEARWAHIDIAGMALAPMEHDTGPAGPTGYGAGLLLSFLLARAGR